MAEATSTPSDDVKALRDQIELALLNRIAASVAQATPAELRELITVYDELMGRWHKR